MDIKYKIVFTPRAKKHIGEIYRYISECLHNEIAAEKLMIKLDKCIENIKNHPRMCPVVIGDGYRKCIVGNYVAFYRIDENSKIIRVFGIYHGSQDYENLF